MNPLTRGVRNTFRNGIRAFSIIAILAVIIGLALAMLIARGAVNDKIASVKSSIGNTITVSPAGVRGFEGGGTPLTSADVAKIAATAHVASTVSTLSARLSSTDTNLTSALPTGPAGEQPATDNTGAGTTDTTGPSTTTDVTETAQRFGGFTPSIQVTGTTDFSSVGDIGTVTLASGSQIDAAGSANEALVGQELATANNLTVGSTFTMYGQTVTVKGIMNTAKNRFAGNAIIVPLKTLQTLASEAGEVTSVIVTVDSIDNEAATVSALQSSLGSSADVVSSQTQAANAVEPLQSIANLSVFVLIASVLVGAVVILLIMVMIVRERRREIGVMKAIGAGNGTVSLQFMVEAVTMTVIAGVAGIILAVVAAGPITNALVTNASTSSSAAGVPGAMGRAGRAFRGGGFGRAFGTAATNIRNVTTHIDWTIVLWGMGAALVIAIIGSFVASLWVARIKPAEAVRAE